MLPIAVILLCLFIVCNGIWFTAIISASRADRNRMDATVLLELQQCPTEQGRSHKQNFV